MQEKIFVLNPADKTILHMKNIVISIIALILLCWLTAWITAQVSENRLREIAVERVALYTSSLTGQLEKYAYLPYVLSQHEAIIRLLEKPTDKRRADVNTYLEEIVTKSKAAAIFVLDPAGTTVASSNWQSPNSFVGHSYRYRPYFQEVLAGRSGRYFAVGATTGLPGLFFPRSVKLMGQLVGVIVIKVDLEALQRDWSLANENVLVTDSNDIVFLSSRHEWRYSALSPVPKKTLARLREARKYGAVNILPLGHSDKIDGNNQRHWYVITGTDSTLAAQGKEAKYMIESTAVPGFRWKLHVLMEKTAIDQRVRLSIFFVVLVISLITVLWLYVSQRRTYTHSVERARDHLESRVRQRTESLEAANVKLRREIDERSRAEHELSDAQTQLLQASKMAALGKMAAVIVHDLNQPLDNIRNFSASGKILLQQNRREELDENLASIIEQTKRMENITRQLRIFSKNDSVELMPVNVQHTVRRTLLLMETPLRDANIEIKLELPQQTFFFNGEELRFEQVLINLIRNAMDAMHDVKHKSLNLMLSIKKLELQIDIVDAGTGISDDAMPLLFEPFYSTKRKNDHLGLGLAICYSAITGYGGKLFATNNADRGATFTIALPLLDRENKDGENRDTDA